jgi:hypothetical protein
MDQENTLDLDLSQFLHAEMVDMMSEKNLGPITDKIRNFRIRPYGFMWLKIVK